MKKNLQESSIIILEISIVAMLVKKMYYFLYSYTKISTKRGVNSIVTPRDYTHIALRATSSSEDTTMCYPA